MNILILGATGRTGRQVARFAVADGHKVVAVIRNKAKALSPGVCYLEGSSTDNYVMNKALKGIDAVVVALNISRKSDNPFAQITSPLTLISDTVGTLIPAMQLNGVKRIISISASGVGDSWKDMHFIARWLIRKSNIWKAYEDHDRQEKLLRNSNLDWTIVRPVMLNNRETEKYTAVLGKPGGGGISRQGVARFIVDILESGKFEKDCVTLFS